MTSSAPVAAHAASRPSAAVAVGGAITVVGMLPMFLVGSLAVQLRDATGLTPAWLGVAAALPSASAAMLSPWLGHVADRLGSRRGIQVAAALTAGACAAIATTVHDWRVLLPWLVLAGSAMALNGPAANRLIVDLVPEQRMGTAFGIKQSAPPTASMLAGFSLPLVALTLGWRWAFGLGAVLALAVLVAATRIRPPRKVDGARPPAPTARTGPLVLLLAATFALGTFGASAVTTFYVDAVVQGGLAPRRAGTLLALASITAIAARVTAGVVSDRMPDGHFGLCGRLVGVGAIGILLLAIDVPTVSSWGVFLALAGGWGFNGVYFFAVISHYREIPGRITGLVAPGGLLGSTIGPIVVGAIVDRHGYQAGWWTAAAVAGVAAAAMLSVQRLMHTRAVPRAT